ncbi:MAG: hypothetical protein J7K21_07770, partial [Desulfurococcales archaeon]|nr:hypothetical protein [Desulfurococcales archaeon]
MMAITQLKPMEEGFFYFIFNRLKPMSTVILCEGDTDVKILKAVIKKLGLVLDSTGITDCEGVNNEPKIIWAIISLTAVARKLENIIAIVDADEDDYYTKTIKIIDSLRSRGINMDNIEPVKCSKQVFKTTVKTSKNINLIIIVNGVQELPFNTHEVEDHIIQLLILERKTNLQSIQGFNKAKEAL